MNASEIVTKADLNAAINEVITHVNTVLAAVKAKESVQSTSRFLKTKDVQNITGYSYNKIKQMRNKGEIPWKLNGGIYAYPEKELREALSPVKTNRKV